MDKLCFKCNSVKMPLIRTHRMTQPTPHFWKVSAMIAFLFCLLVAGVHRGDPAQTYVFEVESEPCPESTMGDWTNEAC